MPDALTALVRYVLLHLRATTRDAGHGTAPAAATNISLKTEASTLAYDETIFLKTKEHRHKL